MIRILLKKKKIMPTTNHYRNGKKRKTWVCPHHPKEGWKKALVGKDCPGCGFNPKNSSAILKEN